MKILRELTLEISQKFKKGNISNIKKKRELISFYSSLINEFIENINDVDELYDLLIKKYKSLKIIEAIYLIDVLSSKQVKETIIENDSSNNLFKASSDGEEHFLKEYYYITLETKQGLYLSQKYISYATGNICKTFTKKIKLKDKEYLLCLDIVI